MSKLLLPRGYRNAELLHNRLNSEAELSWERRGRTRALRLFHEMARRVPAYADFLQSHSFNPNKVTSFNEFHKIPTIDKENYLRKYPQHMLCWDGDFSHGQWVISSTSGSTGQPYYFPREHSQDMQYAVMAELYLRNNFQIQNQKTLYIIAFPMGAWIGGLFTYEALKILAEHSGYDLSIITPGIHKREVINAVKQLGDNFDQIIIGAYAPFLKDILDDGWRDGIDWSKHKLGFIFSAEGFSEKFRDYVLKFAESSNPLLSTLNHYGTVDLGTMAHETPESIMIRRHLVQTNLLNNIFPEKTKQPTLAQYNPEMFYFEELENQLICSAYSGIPLVRYDLHDHGGIIQRTTLHEKLAGLKYDVLSEAKTAKITNTLWNLPFVYVYERNDFSVSYYAFLIYPDTIRRCLQADDLEQDLTGKFTMLVDYDNNGRQILNIHIELKQGVKSNKTLSDSLSQKIHRQLLVESSEYTETSKIVDDYIGPKVHLWQYESNTYFSPGTKQKWTIK